MLLGGPEENEELEEEEEEEGGEALLSWFSKIRWMRSHFDPFVGRERLVQICFSSSTFTLDLGFKIGNRKEKEDL